MKTILDEDLIANKERIVLSSVAWWSRQRKIYNILLIATQAIFMISFWKAVQSFGVGNAIFQSILYTLTANVLYFMGPGLDTTLIYYFDSYKQNNISRNIIFALGILFSIALTCLLYASTLVFIPW